MEPEKVYQVKDIDAVPKSFDLLTTNHCMSANVTSHSLALKAV